MEQCPKDIPTLGNISKSFRQSLHLRVTYDLAHRTISILVDRRGDAK